MASQDFDNLSLRYHHWVMFSVVNCSVTFLRFEMVMKLTVKENFTVKVSFIICLTNVLSVNFSSKFCDHFKA